MADKIKNTSQDQHHFLNAVIKNFQNLKFCSLTIHIHQASSFRLPSTEAEISYGYIQPYDIFQSGLRPCLNFVCFIFLNSFPKFINKKFHVPSFVINFCYSPLPPTQIMIWSKTSNFYQFYTICVCLWKLRKIYSRKTKTTTSIKRNISKTHNFHKVFLRNSLVVQWLRIHLSMQELGFKILGQGTKIPHAVGQLSSHASTREPECYILQKPDSLEPCTTIREACMPQTRANAA